MTAMRKSASSSRGAASLPLLFSPHFFCICPLRNRRSAGMRRFSRPAPPPENDAPILRNESRLSCSRRSGSCPFPAPGLSGRCRKKNRAPASSALFVNAHAGVGMGLSHFDKNRAKKSPARGRARMKSSRPAWPNVQSWKPCAQSGRREKNDGSFRAPRR